MKLELQKNQQANRGPLKTLKKLKTKTNITKKKKNRNKLVFFKKKKFHSGPELA